MPLQLYGRSLQMNQLEALENLLIVTLFQQPTIIEHTNGQVKQIEIRLEEGKEIFCKKYIGRYHLEKDVRIESNLLQFAPSLGIERIVRDWTSKGEIIGLNPNKMSSNLFMLWICLFGRKTSNNVVIATNLDTPIKQTIRLFFQQYLQTDLMDKGSLFQIKPFTNILLKSYQEKRTLEETEELNKLLTDKERLKLKKVLISWERYYELT